VLSTSQFWNAESISSNIGSTEVLGFLHITWESWQPLYPVKELDEILHRRDHVVIVLWIHPTNEHHSFFWGLNAPPLCELQKQFRVILHQLGRVILCLLQFFLLWSLVVGHEISSKIMSQTLFSLTQKEALGILRIFNDMYSVQTMRQTELVTMFHRDS